MTTSPAPGTLFDKSKMVPAPLVRDEDGYFYHPAVAFAGVDGDEDNPPTFDLQVELSAIGYEFRAIELCDDINAPESLQEAVNAGMDYDLSQWHPAAPCGAGWFLFIITENDDGPVALFVRRKFSTGDTVYLKSGSCGLTVICRSGEDDSKILVMWHDDDCVKQEDAIDYRCLCFAGEGIAAATGNQPASN